MSFTAIIDILVVAFIFYKGYMLIKETRAEQLLKGIAFIIILIPISAILNLSMLYFILSGFKAMFACHTKAWTVMIFVPQ